MKEKVLLIILIALLIVIGSSISVIAGTTGKISGKITDASNGEPLISANVVLKGTSLGAATDIDGLYTITNIPPGVYTVTISIIGYQTLQYNNVKVSVDLTTNLDAQLHQEAISLETMVITAERPLVIKDNTGSLSTVSAEQIKNMPVQSISDILRLDAGIVEARGRLHIRGGRAGEISYWVDGISTTDAYDGSSGVRVENLAVQELQVISGTFNAEYGQAMSGIVNTITREGEEKYAGQIRIYGGDYISSDKVYSMYKRLKTEEDPTTGGTKIVDSERVQPLKLKDADIKSIQNLEFNLSGPIPLFNNLRFFLLGRYYYDDGYYYGVNWFKPNGAPGDSTVVSMNPYKSLSAQGKINYQLTNSIKLGYSVFWNKTQRDRNYFNGNITSHDYLYNPYGLPQNFGEGLTQTFSLNHVLSSKTFYEARISRYFSETKQYKYNDPTQKINYLVRRADGTTFNPFTPAGIDTLSVIKARNETFTYIADPDGPEGYIDPTTLGQPTNWSYVAKGMDPNHFNRSTSFWAGKFDMSSQINKTNEIKLGAEVRLHELELHSFRITSKKDAIGNVIIPFEPAVPEVGSLNRDDYIRKPIEISAYIQDKLEFQSIILNIGLRFDYFDANSVVPVDPNDPNIYDPFKNKHIYANWIPKPANYRGTDGQYIDSLLRNEIIEKYTPDERRAFMHKKVNAKMSLSPRLGFSFPITDKGIMHFSYGHFSQIPQFQYIYANPDFKVSSSSGSVLMGNADLEPQRTVMYEIGLQQQLTDAISVNATLFYRDVRGWVGTSPLIDLMRDGNRKTGSDYSKYENKDYENVKGITLKIEKRFSENYSFRADYTLQSAEGTYSDATDAYNDMQNNRAPVIALLPLNFDQRHTLNLQFMYSISDWMFSLIGRYWSGLPYTPSAVSGSTGSSAATGFTINSARLPEQKIIDLTISRMIQLTSKLNIQLFLNVYNLLDQRDATSVYTDTGSPEYTTTNTVARVYNPLRIGTVEDFTNQWSWYTAPRQVQIGLALGF